MTDNEIIKALECSVKNKCPECPYFHSYPCDKCRKMLTDVLDLINRQKAKIEALEMDKEQLESDVFNANMNCEHLQAEIERLQKDSKRLKKVQMQLDDLCIMHNIIKAEAVKEFAERLHEELRIYGIKDKFNKSVFLNVVDKAKKELVGEDE